MPKIGFKADDAARTGLLERERGDRKSGSGAMGVLSREDGADGVDDSCRTWLLESTSLTGGGC